MKQTKDQNTFSGATSETENRLLKGGHTENENARALCLATLNIAEYKYSKIR